MQDAASAGGLAAKKVRGMWGNLLFSASKLKWHRIVSLMGVFVSMSSLMITMPFFATHASNAFHVSEATVGFAIACSPIAQVITTPLWGIGAAKYGRANCLLLSLILICSGSTFLSLAKSMRSCMIGRFMQGCGTQGSMTAGVAMFLDGSQNMGKDMGYVELLVGVAYMVAPAVGGAVYQQYGFALAVVPAVVFAGFTAILTVLTVRINIGGVGGISYDALSMNGASEPGSPIHMIHMDLGDGDLSAEEEALRRHKKTEGGCVALDLAGASSTIPKAADLASDDVYNRFKNDEKKLDLARKRTGLDEEAAGGGEGGDGKISCSYVLGNRTAVWVCIAISAHSGGQVFADMVLGKHLFLSQGADAALSGAVFAVAPAVYSVACIVVGANKHFSNRTMIAWGLFFYALGFYFLAPPPGLTSEDDFIGPASLVKGLDGGNATTSPHPPSILSETIVAGFNTTFFEDSSQFLPAWRLSRKDIWVLDIAGLTCMGIGSALILVPAVPLMISGFQSASPNADDPTDMVTSIYSGSWSLGELIGPPFGGMLLENLPRERDINCQVSASDCFWAFHWTMLTFTVLIFTAAAGFAVCVPKIPPPPPRARE